MKKDTKKKIMAALLGVSLVGAGMVGGFVLDKPATITQVVERPVIVEKQVPVEVIKEVVVEKEIITPGETIMVEDEEFLKLSCDRLMFDDIMECKEEVTAEDAALQKALTLLDTDKLFSVLEKEGLIEDEDEARLLRVYDDFEDIEVVASDFDDDEYEFRIKLRVSDDEAELKKTVFANVEVIEGKAKILSIEE